MNFYIKTYGCKVNQYNSELLKENLLNNNADEIKNIEDSDILIINSCVVTEKAEKEVYRFIKKYNNKKRVFIFGCISDNLKNKISEFNIEYDDENVFLKSILNNNNPKVISTISMFGERTRAYLKIQSGCNRFCSYCIVPSVRGKIYNKNSMDIFSEIENLLKNGYKEIVLTGTQIGLYNDPELSNLNLSNLIEDIVNKYPLIKRLRISSIDPSLVDNKLIELMKKNKIICNHLHIPLQSGSTKILNLMNRKYNSDFYVNLINDISSNVEDFAVTTDIIVGFPEESYLDFLKTIEVVKKVNFSKIHIFPYSDRSNTTSIKMKNKVDINDINKRINELLVLSKLIGYNLRKKYINNKVEVLLESGMKCFTRNYLKVILNKNRLIKPGMIDTVIINNCDFEYLFEKN